MAEDPTVDVRSIMKIAGWQDPRLLDRYAAASDERMRHAVGAADAALGEVT